MDGTVGYKPAESSGAKWLAIINPSAAGGSAAAEWPLIDRLLRRAGITAEAVFTAHRYHAVELTVAAVNDGIRHIIAVGGDTTLHEVVNGLFIQRAVRPEEITLGIIPTGNCRIAGIPKTYPEAVSAIASGYVSLYHIATVSYSQSHYRQERLMAGEAGMGLYAMLAARFNRLREEGKATVPRRLWAVLESILSYRAPQVRIYADGQSVYCGRAAGATLVISGELEPLMASSLCQHVLFLEREDPSSPITLFVSSPGGQVGPGLAIYDVLRSVSCPIRTVCSDLAASMGSIIFMAGDEREMYPHASLMIHDPLIPQGAGGSALALQETSKRLMERRRTLNTILAERSGPTLKRIQSLTCKDTYLEAERALDLGFATRIIESRKEL